MYGRRPRLGNLFAGLGLLPKQTWEDIDVTFIVSTGRTGTRFFARFFGSLPGVYARHEPKPDMVKLGVDYAAGRVPFEKAQREIERNRRAIAREVRLSEASRYIESNNRFFSLLKPLREVFPHSRIIHVMRDGRDYVRSGLGRNWYTEKDRFPRLRADMFPDDPLSDKWEELDRFEKIAWRWQKKDAILYRDVAELDNTLTVKFEDIFNAPGRPGLFTLSNFIGLSDELVRSHLERFGTYKVNATRRSPIPAWSQWDQRMRRRFEEIAGEHMRRCGYS